MIAIIDYGMGNIFSIYNALKHVGGDPAVIDEPTDLQGAEGVVVPGVGSFGRCMQGLSRFEDTLYEMATSGTPLFGICIGMQVLFERSEESPEKGFGWFPGEVIRLPEGQLVPHIGWNSISIKREVEILDEIAEGSFFYFVHSYHCIFEDRSLLAANCEYGVEIAAVISRDNISAVQFHPEKSGERGLKILENFVRSTKC